MRAAITVEGVLQAIAEFDKLGRKAFLENYGFNGARDYFLVHNGKNYDSKAIAAVAHIWAPDGDGKPLTSLELSGGKMDAAKKLSDLGFTIITPGHNSDWTEDEHILALELYMKNPTSPPDKQSPEIHQLSNLLRLLGQKNGMAMTDKFRNANGVYMKLMNFRRLDPRFQAQGKSGLTRGSKGEEAVWNKFANNQAGLKAAAEAIKMQLSQQLVNTPIDQKPIATDISVAAFDLAWAKFLRLVEVNDKGRPFSKFTDGVVGAWENYKTRLRDHALAVLSVEDWLEEEVGTGRILERVINAIEIQDHSINQINNLVFWQNRYGHANRDHRALIEASTSLKLAEPLERAFFALYCSESDEGHVFDTLSQLSHAKYPLLAYLYFLKDSSRFMPIQPTTFDKAFRTLDVNLTTLRNCSWDNYCAYNDALRSLQYLLETRAQLGAIRLVDAHSFCWLLEKLPSRAEKSSPNKTTNAGRIVGGREKAILSMRYSIEHTVRNSNGQTVDRTVKNKDLNMSRLELEQLLSRLLEMQGNRCALTGIAFQYDDETIDKNLLPSPDRKDSNGHYDFDNLQIVCRFVNFWKRDTPNDEFVRLLKLVQGVEPS